MNRGIAFVTAALLAMALLLATPASAQERLIGLLQLPEVFGSGPCVPFFPRSVALFDQPDGKTIGTVEVDQNWSFAPHGGCEGLEVRVHQGQTRSELPTREYDYDAPAAIVAERRGSWFKIRLRDGAFAWVKTDVAARFLSLESLLEEFFGVTYLTGEFQGELVTSPGSTAKVIGARLKPGQPVQVIESRRSGDLLWLHVEVMSHSLCDAGVDGPPDAIGKGWLPANDSRGEPTVWFASRGC